MTATYGTISTVTYGSRTNTTITAPASIVNGNLLFLAHITVQLAGVAPTQTLPAGFTAIGTRQFADDGGGNGYSVVMAYKIAASEAGDYTVTHTVANAAGFIIRVDGTGTLSVDAFSQNKSTVNGPTATALSVTPTAADDLLFYVGLNWDATALTPPAGMTERLDSAIAYVASQALASGAATGNVTQTVSSGSLPWFANLVAIKDAAAAAARTLDLNFAASDTLDPRITFSRTSLGTCYGSDGLLKYAAHNLLLQSQTFDNASWIKGAGATVTADLTTAPDGTTTADRLNHVTAGTVAAGYISQGVGLSLGKSIVSVYAKAGTKGWIAFGTSSSSGVNVYFNLTAGTIGTRQGAWTASGIQNVGNGWYRCWAAIGVNPSTCYTKVAEADATNQCTSPGDIFIWGAQYEDVTTATTPSTYLPTTTVAVHGPRFDYDPVTLVAKGLLIEESRSTILTFQQDFTNAVWVKTGATITADQTTAPDGTTTADLVTSSATPATVYYQLTTINAGVSYVTSVYVKKGSSDWCYIAGDITVTGPESPKAYFNLATGVVGTIETNITSATIQNVGNGWYRCTLARLGTAGTERFMIGICDADNSATVTVGRTIYLWGAQAETNVTFASSYIPGAAANRAADVAVMTGTNFSSWYNQSAGTFVAEFDLLQPASGIRNIMTVDSGTAAEQVLFYRNASAFLRLDGRAAGTPIYAIQSPGTVTAGVNNAGLSAAANDFAACLNGGAVGVDTAGAMPTPTILRLGTETGGTNILNGHVRRIQFWNTAKSDAELQTITDPAYVEPPVEPPVTPPGSGLAGGGTGGTAYWGQDRGEELSRKRRRAFLQERDRRIRDL